MLSNSKVIVFDEATSALDKATDNIIQSALSRCFQSSTLLVIAHRLKTVCNFDKIVVLDQGRLIEFGTPRELWNNNGIFRGMCEKAEDDERMFIAETLSDQI